MRITQWGEYATHFCVYIAKQELGRQSTVSATEIASSLGVDQLYAQQILQRLRKGNIVQSIRGAQGGYRLVKSPEEITLKDILVASEGDTFEPLCESKPIDAHKCAATTHCGLRGVWYELREHIDSFLNDKTLRNLLDLDSNLVTISPKGPVLELAIEGANN